jgi:hypothetical protein
LKNKMTKLFVPDNVKTLAALLCVCLFGCNMTSGAHGLPRNQSLPLFNPHIPSFICEIEASKVPPIDAQAEAWFVEARALEAPETVEDDRDYKKIVQLTRQAAERHHWKAMLNLASLYVEKRDSAHGVEDAVKVVEEAMRLGIPAAYDRMGTYHMNGTGVKADATRAYAFWQKAAQMGNPQAMTFLGDKLRAGKDGALAGYWANIPVSGKMLECALTQGYGPAAENPHFFYELPRAPDGTIIGERTRETKARALKALHEGVKFGCANCAAMLSSEFDRPIDPADMLAPYIDKARGERYGMLSDALDVDPDRRFPNLDKVLPLPPAQLPSWDGKRDTLLEAAMGVSLHRPPPPKPGAASQNTGRSHLDAAFALRHRGVTITELQAPASAYWKPAAPAQADHVRATGMMLSPYTSSFIRNTSTPTPSQSGYTSGFMVDTRTARTSGCASMARTTSSHRLSCRCTCPWAMRLAMVVRMKS